jgi:hypothetical protein
MGLTSNPNRMVAALTPVVFAPLAGAISVLAAKYFPGVDIPSGSVEAIFIAGATIAFAKAGLWLKGWQEYEKRDADADAATDAGGGIHLDDAPDLGDEPDLDSGPDLEGDPDLDDGPDLDSGPDLDDEPDPDDVADLDDEDDLDDDPDLDDEPEPVATGQEA